MQKCSRRNFIGLLIESSIITLCLPVYAQRKVSSDLLKKVPKEAYVIADGKSEYSLKTAWKGITFGDVKALPSDVLIFDTEFNLLKKFRLSFYSHKFYQNPANKSQIIGMQKRGQRMTTLNLVSDSVSELTAPLETSFFGHGFFDLQGKFFFAAAMDYRQGHGVLLKYSADTLKLLETWPTYGVFPHDIQLWDENPSNHCVVLNIGRLQKTSTFRPLDANTSMRSNASIIDYSTGKLVKQVTSVKGAGLSHFAQLGGGKIFATGVSDPVRNNKTQIAIVDMKDERAYDLSSNTDLTSIKGETNNPIFIPERNSVVFNSYSYASEKREILEFSLTKNKLVHRITFPDFMSHFYMGKNQMLAAPGNLTSPFKKVDLDTGVITLAAESSVKKPATLQKGAGVHFNKITI